ncbi:energy transducer TonB [Roseateles terrae]|uniref:TonB family protein n=1 Tax=Roseateles terrae TaxID=431060 RepID=A0ABR6GSS3_9BURK|nr:energy transducer TonB [Roseateles terrae]MBB3195114.1 TonB family protein [Roseateles terrae]
MDTAEAAETAAFHPDVSKTIAATAAPSAARSALPDTSPQPASFPANHQQCQDTQTARFYPALLRDRGVQGLVRLRVKVDDNGRAAEVLIADGSGFRLLDEAARRVAESCPYVPAREGGQRVSSWIEYAVRFALSPPSSAL